jgi:flagellar secretion chaperone FliS
MTAQRDYLESQVMTATPHQLHLTVVDGGIRFAVAAEAALGENDVRKARAALGRAREFVTELIGGLDDKRQPEVIKNVRSLFIFVNRCLVRADLRRDPAQVRDAIQILRLHRETWISVGEALRAERAAKLPATVDVDEPKSSFSWSS